MKNDEPKIEECSSSSEEQQSTTWIDQYMETEIGGLLLKVPIEFIKDKFNMFGISKHVENYEKSHKILLGLADEAEDCDPVTLYNMIHQRYVFTKIGLEDIFEKVMRKEYGVCRNISCSQSPLIPTGLTDIPRISTVKNYCCNCRALFNPKGRLSLIDSCAFGRSFAPFMVMTYKNNFPKTDYGKYVPRIFGFRIFEDDSNK